MQNTKTTAVKIALIKALKRRYSEEHQIPSDRKYPACPAEILVACLDLKTSKVEPHPQVAQPDGTSEQMWAHVNTEMLRNPRGKSRSSRNQETQSVDQLSRNSLLQGSPKIWLTVLNDSLSDQQFWWNVEHVILSIHEIVWESTQARAVRYRFITLNLSLPSLDTPLY